MTSAVSGHVGNELANYIKLMESGEHQPLLDNLLIGCRVNFLFDFEVHELLNDVKHRIFLEYLLPEVIGWISIRIGRVALAAVVPSAVATLVERQKECLAAIQLGSHKYIGMIDTEEPQYTTIKRKASFRLVAVVHPLTLGVLDRLASVLIL